MLATFTGRHGCNLDAGSPAECVQSRNQLGDIEHAFVCAAYHYLNCGLPLSSLSLDLKTFVKLLKQYQQQSLYLVFVNVWQKVMNYMGQSRELTVLTGDSMTQEGILQNN